MDDSRAIPDRTGWNAVHVSNAGRTLAAVPSRRRRWIGAAAFAVVVAGMHGALGYFGWNWLKRQQAPEILATAPAPVAKDQEPLPEQRYWKPRPNPKADAYDGRMRWTRAEGTTIGPSVLPEWKCAGGFYFTTSKGADGSTVVAMVEANGRPMRCQ